MNPLDQLRDVHLPVTPSWYPLSDSAYYAIGITFLIFIWGSMMLFTKWRRGRARRKAILQIEKYRKQSDIDIAIIVDLSVLLRRVALAYYPRKQVAGLSGERWIKFLYDTAIEKFDKDTARILLTAPYQREFVGESEELLALASNWIRERK